MSDDYARKQLGLSFYDTDISMLDFVKRKAKENDEGAATYIKNLIKLEMLRCGEPFEPNPKAARSHTKAHVRRVQMSFGIGEDDVFEWLKSQENTSGYICDLVRDDMHA